MIKENKLLEFLKSNAFILYVAIFTVVFQAPNTYYVYHSFSVFSSPYREIAAAGVATIVSASIMIYTLRKNFFVAKCYSVFEVGIAFYYYIDTIGWDWGLIPAFGISLIIPISVYYYTKEINNTIEPVTGREIDALHKDYGTIIEKLQNSEYKLIAEITKANSIIDRDAETIALLTAEVEAQRTAVKIANTAALHVIAGEAALQHNIISPDDKKEDIDLSDKNHPLNQSIDLKKKSGEEKKGFWNSKEQSFF